MPRVKHSRGGVSIKAGGQHTLSSKLRDPNVTDLTEEELGIFEDDADCADLTESEDGGEEADDYGDEALDTIRGAPLPAPKSYISNSTNNTAVLSTTTKNIIDVQMSSNVGTEIPRVSSEVSDAAHTIYSGKRNTPATMYAEHGGFDERRSHLVPSSDSMFRQAMTLMTERCTSVTVDPSDGRQTPLVTYKETPYGQHPPKMFYVQQTKPVPMPPLKAWRGYNGNVYFEPIKVNPAPTGEEPLDLVTEAHRAAAYNRLNSRQSDKSVPRGPSVQSISTMGEQGSTKEGPQPRSRSTISLAASTKTTTSNRQMSILDRKSVFMNQNDFLHEDLSWIVGQENTGSLCVTTGPKKQPGIRHSVIPRDNGRHKPIIEKPNTKICKGSVAHQIYAKNQQYPLLTVRGGRYFYNQKDKKNYIRGQTKYTQNSLRRAGLTTPDPNYRPDYRPDHRLPPLEQVSITGRIKSEPLLPPVGMATRAPPEQPYTQAATSAHRQAVK